MPTAWSQCWTKILCGPEPLLPFLPLSSLALKLFVTIYFCFPSLIVGTSNRIAERTCSDMSQINKTACTNSLNMKWYLVELLYSVKTNRLLDTHVLNHFLFSVNSLLSSHTWVKGASLRGDIVSQCKEPDWILPFEMQSAPQNFSWKPGN